MSSLTVQVCIPARLGATRYPEKPLAKILGRPMIAWVIEGVQQSKQVTSVVLATDDLKIAEVGRSIGAEVVMTPSDLPSGTDRIWNACKQKKPVDIVVNIQGDEPLVKGFWIDELLKPFANPKIEMTTLGTVLRSSELDDKNTVKVIKSKSGRAIYFSRFGIPFSRLQFVEKSSPQICFKHLGVYAYRWNSLEKFCSYPKSNLETAESLEQLRALENDIYIALQTGDFESQSVDVKEDIEKVEKILRARGH